MQTLTRDTDSIMIDAPPDIVFGLVSDIDQMARISPELVSCQWLDGADGPAVGARFEAVNQLPGHRPWKNRPVIVAYDPPRMFATSRTEPFAGTVVWTYEIQIVGNLTQLTESYNVVKPVSRLGWLIIERGFGGTDRAGDLRAGIQKTLRAIKAAAESTPPAAGT